MPAVPGRAVRRQHLTQELLDAPGSADLVGRVVGLEDVLQTGQGFGAQLVAGTQQEPAVRPGRVIPRRACCSCWTRWRSSVSILSANITG